MRRPHNFPSWFNTKEIVESVKDMADAGLAPNVTWRYTREYDGSRLPYIGEVNPLPTINWQRISGGRLP